MGALGDETVNVVDLVWPLTGSLITALSKNGLIKHIGIKRKKKGVDKSLTYVPMTYSPDTGSTG